MPNATSPRVFAVQQPTGRDPATGSIVNTMDLSPAAEWGELVFILPPTHNPFDDIDETGRRVWDVLTERGFGEEDVLLLVGNPALIAVVSAVAACITSGRLRLLQWQRSRGEYWPLEINLERQEPMVDAGGGAA